MKLFDILFLNSLLKVDQEMYIRCSNLNGINVIDEHKIELKPYSVISTDTYFNSLSIHKYMKYTNAKEFYVQMNIEGRVDIEIKFAYIDENKNIKTVLLKRCTKDSTTSNTFKEYLPLEKVKRIDGIIYLEIINQNINTIISNPYFGCDLLDKPNEVKLAINMCTFKREDYVYRNCLYLKEKLEALGLNEKIHLFIVDNGQTLNSKMIECDFIDIIPNKNLGGSGGFSRGMIEAYKSNENFTDIILMDDDIILHINALYKVYSFLLILKNEYRNISIGGSMLYLEETFKQFEAGGKIQGLNQLGINKLADLRLLEQVLRNELCNSISYNGWWFMCMSMQHIRNGKFPLPMFIKYDDVEYALRCNMDIITLNGVAVWHENFDKKYSSVLDYYNRRNYWIMHAINSIMPGKRKFIRIMKKDIIDKVYKQQYRSAELIYDAYNDFLNGIDYLANLDSEQKHNDIIEKSQKLLRKKDLQEKIGKELRLNPRKKENFICKVFRKLTLNGYLIPKKLYKRIDYKINDMVYDIKADYFLVDKAVHYNKYTQTGFITEINKKELNKYYKNVQLLEKRIKREYKKICLEYKNNYNILCNINFWKEHLKIH